MNKAMQKSIVTTREKCLPIGATGNEFVLATAVASPIVIRLWASVLFVAGMIDYLLESDLGGHKYQIVAIVSVGISIEE